MCNPMEKERPLSVAVQIKDLWYKGIRNSALVIQLVRDRAGV